MRLEPRTPHKKKTLIKMCTLTSLRTIFKESIIRNFILKTQVKQVKHM